jgi:hypothetical protein
MISLVQAGDSVKRVGCRSRRSVTRAPGVPSWSESGGTGNGFRPGWPPTQHPGNSTHPAPTGTVTLNYTTSPDW